MCSSWIVGLMSHFRREFLLLVLGNPLVVLGVSLLELRLRMWPHVENPIFRVESGLLELGIWMWPRVGNPITHVGSDLVGVGS